MFIYICIYVYTVYTQACLSGRSQALQGAKDLPGTASEPDCAGGSWVFPGGGHGKSELGLPAAAPGKYPPSTNTVSSDCAQKSMSMSDVFF